MDTFPVLYLFTMDSTSVNFQLANPIGTKLKRRMFFISVFGVTAPDEYVILKVTQDTSVYDAIAQVFSFDIA